MRIDLAMEHEQGQPKRRSHADAIQKSDMINRIDQLPEHVILEILQWLPTKDAVVTSALSHSWRYKWTVLHTLDLDYETVFEWGPRLRTPGRRDLRWAQIVDHVIVSRKAPIRKCRIANCRVGCGSSIEKLFLFLGTQGLEELDFSYAFEYGPIPSPLFLQYDSLCRLDLYRGTIQLPAEFRGFRNLRTLTMEKIRVGNDDFRRMVCQSQLLESLTVDRCTGYHRLDFSSCTLKSLNICGDELVPVVLKPATKLATLSMIVDEGDDSGDGGRIVMGALKGLVHLESLHLSLNSFNAGSSFLDERACFLLPALVRIDIYVKMQDPLVVDLLCCLFERAPYLQKLIIKMDISAVEDRVGFDNYWVTGKPFTFQKHYLEHVTIWDLRENFHMDFARFILLYTQVLKKMTVHFAKGISCTRKQSFTKELFDAQKGSPGVKLVIK